VVKDVDDEYNDGEWDVVEVVVEKEVMRRVVVVVEVIQWEEDQTKAKPSQENQPTHERSESRRRKHEAH
jgi:hypothetical protein